MRAGKLWFAAVLLLAFSTGTVPALAVDLIVRTDNGITTIVYNGQQVFMGPTSGKVSAKAASDNGVELAAAFDDARMVWENVPGAGERLRSMQHDTNRIRQLP
jgi:hypothetical protein